MERTQGQTIQKLCLNRKTENFQLLKQWDKQRASRLMVHRKLIDEFDESLTEKIVESTAYIDVVRQFLTDLLTQRYELQSVTNPQPLMKNNMAGKRVYKRYGQQLDRLYQITNQQKGHKHLKNVLQAGLAKIQKLFNQSQREITQVRTSIEVQVLQLQNSNQLTLQACQKVMQVFGNDKNTKPFQSQDDLFRAEQQFMYQAYCQTATQQRLGVCMSGYLELVQQLQSKKLVLVKQVIGSYLQAMHSWSQNQEHLLPLKDILGKSTQQKYIQECYSPEQLLSNQILLQISALQHKHQKQLSSRHIKQILKQLDFTFFNDITYLCLKQYKIYMKRNGELQSIIAIVTINAFLNIYCSGNQFVVDHNSQHILYPVIDYRLKLDSSVKMQKDGDICLQVWGRKMWSKQTRDQPQHLWLVFANDDQRQEFYQYAQTIIMH